MSNKKRLKKSTSKLISFRLKVPNLITEIQAVLIKRRRRAEGSVPDEAPSVSLIINHAIGVVHGLETDPDTCIANIPASLASMNQVVLSSVEREMGKILTGLEIKYEVTRGEDGRLRWDTKYTDGTPRNSVSVGPEVIARPRQNDEVDPLLVRAERGFTVN